MYTPSEMMVVEAARNLRDGERVFVGIGMPNLAANLAKRLHAPNIVMIYESGVVGADPARLPLSIGDPCLVTGAVSVCSMYDVFASYLQNGLVDVGFLGAAQVDKFGNLNSTVIGDYSKPRARLAGSGGACEIACLAKRIIMLLPQSRRRFPESVDFVTSPGFLRGRKEREAFKFPGGGPEKVITNLGVLEFNEEGEMVLASVHPGVELDEVRANTGWDLKTRAGGVKTTEPPSERELFILRNELDPRRIYLGKSE